MSVPQLSDDLRSSIHQLKQQYPTSTLTAEFIAHQGGEYAVRAMITIDGSLVTTAMAAAATIEAAEDRAKMRAIECLGVRLSESLSPLPTSLSTGSSPENSLPEDALSVAESTTKPTTTKPLLKRDRPTDSSTAVSASTPQDDPISTHAQTPPPQAQDDLYSGPNLEEPMPESSAPVPTSSVPTSSAVEEQPAEPPAPPSSSASGSLNTDLSDAIAKTTVEMRRLGWDIHQGRQHLQERYGKRSRGELTDAELLDFLSYLESQPNVYPTV